ncbi:MAG: transcriptional regulator, LysR family [Labilithrix sp.]|nr:transcriptional regulator, LysR family [Labilithrix sp.]
MRLFDRTSRRVTVTQEGRRLLERAGPVADELAEILGDVAEREHTPSGRLRVTAPLISGAGAIGRALLDFAAHHPRVSLELSLSNSVVDLVEEGFDLGFRSGPINDPSLVVRRLWTLPSTLAASPGFVRRELRGRRLLTRDAMLRVPAVTTTAGPWRFRRADGTSDDITPNERLRVNDPRVAVDAAKLDLGVIRAMSDALVGTDLVTLTCEIGALEPRDLYAVFPSRRLMPMRVRMAIDWVAAKANPEKGARSQDGTIASTRQR